MFQSLLFPVSPPFFNCLCSLWSFFYHSSILDYIYECDRNQGDFIVFIILMCTDSRGCVKDVEELVRETSPGPALWRLAPHRWSYAWRTQFHPAHKFAWFWVLSCGSFLGYTKKVIERMKKRKVTCSCSFFIQYSRGHSLSNTRCAVHVLGHTWKELQCAWGDMTEATCWCSPDLPCDSTSLWQSLCSNGPWHHSASAAPRADSYPSLFTDSEGSCCHAV